MPRPEHLARIVLITDVDGPALTEDDRILGAALSGSARVDVVAWDAPDSLDRISGAEVAVIRSTWNYTEALPAFLDFVDALRRARVTLCNPADVVRWNCDKHYLLELERRGVATLPTVLLDRHPDEPAPDELEGLMDERGWRDVIVKPTVSATAKGLFRVQRSEAAIHRGRYRMARQATDLMVQPVAPEVERDGEWSLMFFGGGYSHAVRKRAVPGDFRVQSDFGGTASLEEPPPALIADAEALLDVVHGRFPDAAPLLYARVDGIERGGRLVLMELELIEPELFFRSAPASAGRCAAALLERL